MRIISILIFCLLGIAAYYFFWYKPRYHTQMQSLPPVVLRSPDKIFLYTKSYCHYCDKAKELFSQKAITPHEIDITNDQALHDELKRMTNQKTVPYIFIYGNFVGGFSELEDLNQSGKLDQMLKVDPEQQRDMTNQDRDITNQDQ